jgi:histidinol dehydrogenase
MAGLKIRRVVCASPESAKFLNTLRDQAEHQAETVTAQGKRLTNAVFGEPLSPAQVVERICTDVRQKGLSAVLHYTEQFDKVKLDKQTVRVKPTELAEAHQNADPDLLDTIRRVKQNIVSFHSGLLQSDAVLSVSGSHELHMRYRPMRRVGICIPGGVAAYPSTLLMTVCPAQVAGVQEIAVVIPPTKNGAYNQDLLAVCQELGVTEVYRLGGAQAVAALAYGVEGIAPVDMIVGPGGLYVALAKKYVFGKVAIDCLAGPSEVTVVADESAQPEYVACDLIAQAEHAGNSVCVLVTWHEPLLDEVTAVLERRLRDLPRSDFARESLERYGAMILAGTKAEAAECVNRLASEHVHIQTRDPEAFADKVEQAGSIFLGSYTPVALGDYAAGPSHVLPTGGTARFGSGLTANDFLRRTSMMAFTRNGLRDIADDVLYLAEREGLSGHAASVDVRLTDNHVVARPPRKDKAKQKT